MSFTQNMHIKGKHIPQKIGISHPHSIMVQIITTESTGYLIVQGGAEKRHVFQTASTRQWVRVMAFCKLLVTRSDNAVSVALEQIIMCLPLNRFLETVIL